jgi:hypothetical protein
MTVASDLPIAAAMVARGEAGATVLIEIFVSHVEGDREPGHWRHVRVVEHDRFQPLEDLAGVLPLTRLRGGPVRGI